jgi:DNA-binding Lrp family transcriptional regulator
MMKSGPKDMYIITNLRENARRHLKEISGSIGMPVSTVYERLKSMHGRHIRRFTCILDYELLGYPVRAKILIKARKDAKESLTGFLHACASMNSVFRINNGYDFMVEGIFRSMQDVEHFLEEMETKQKVQRVDVFYVIENLKEEAFMTNPFLK